MVTSDSGPEITGQQVLEGFEPYNPRPIKSRKLSQKQKNFISFCEQYYHKNRGQFPSTEQCAYALKYSLIEIKYFLQDQAVIEALMKRGLDVEILMSQQANTYLSPTQIGAALVVCNFADTRSVDTKLESMGVTATEYYAWLKSPVYRDFVTNLADQTLENIKPEAMTVFAQLIRDGNTKALQMYFQMTGQLDGQNEAVQNLKVTLSRVIEAVAAHVQDQTVLSKIAADIGIAAPVAGDARVALPAAPSNSIEEVTSSPVSGEDVEGVRSL